jgi:hypothetical protein
VERIFLFFDSIALPKQQIGSSCQLCVSGKSIDQTCKAIEGSTFQKGEDGICLLLQNRMKDNEGEKAHSLDKVIMFQSTSFRACICFYCKQEK